MRLYIYGYLNRIRSSRQLEKEYSRNIELMWLMKGLAPDHNTIANFRKDNPKAIRKIFHATVSLAKNFDLIGAKLLAGDSTKLRAQKRQWGFNYIMTKKTIKHASADVGLIFTAFNLRRILNIVDHNLHKKYLKVLACFFGSITAVLKSCMLLFFYLSMAMPAYFVLLSCP